MAKGKERIKMPLLNAQERAASFDEVALGYSLDEAQKEADRCLNCKNAPCKRGCPVGIDIPQFITHIKDGDILKAGLCIKNDNSLPSICGRVCPQEVQCEKLCVRNKLDLPVAIGSLERFAGDYMLNNNSVKTEKIIPSGKKAAVVGSGPASLSCAAELASAGVDVTIFEAFHKAGGVLVYGIPQFRLPKNIVEKETGLLKEKGVKFELNTVIGKTVTVPQLLEEFDAVFIGSGAGLPVFLGISGEGLNGVLSANEYLTRINLMKAYEKNSVTPVQRGKNVVVIGAGNVAMDAARTALRMGSSSVKIVYRRSREEMPARKEEIIHAEEEGVEFCLLTNPLEITGREGKAVSIRCIKMELGAADESGRRSPVPIGGSEFEIETDLIIVALGTSPNPLITSSFKDIKTGKKGNIEVDENMRTSVKGLYAGGDAVTGAATVIMAMGAGRKASKTMLKDLGLRE